MGQCCLGGENTEKKSLDEKVNNEVVTVEPVKPKSSHLSGIKPAASTKSCKSLKKTSVKSAIVPLKGKSKVEAVMTTTLISKEPSKLKMERGPKVKIVVDEQRILQNIKEKQTMRAEIAQIGQRGRSATSSLSPGSLKSPKRSAPAPQSKDKPKSKPKSPLKSSLVSSSKSQSGPNRSTMSVDFNSLNKPKPKASGSATGNKPNPSAIGTGNAKSTLPLASSHSQTSGKSSK